MDYLSETELKSAVRETVKRTLVDADFRRLAMQDGNAAIAKAAGKSVPSGTVITFVGNQGSGRSIVLPDPLISKDQISEDDLERIAGGLLGTTNCCCSASTD